MLKFKPALDIFLLVVAFILFGCAANQDYSFDYQEYADRFPYKQKDVFATTNITQLGNALTAEEKRSLFQSFADAPSIKIDPARSGGFSQTISIDSIDCFLFSDQGIINGYSEEQKYHLITVYTIHQKTKRRSILWLAFAKDKATLGSQQLNAGSIANRFVDSRVMLADQFETDSIYFTKGSEMIAPDLYKITEVSMSKYDDTSEVRITILRTVPHHETIEDFQRFVNASLVDDFVNTELRSKYKY